MMILAMVIGVWAAVRFGDEIRFASVRCRLVGPDGAQRAVAPPPAPAPSASDPVTLVPLSVPGGKVVDELDADAPGVATCGDGAGIEGAGGLAGATGGAP